LTIRRSKKLDWKCIELYKITEVISSRAYRIKISHQLHIHNVQLISFLEKAAQDPLLHQQQEPPPPVIVDRDEEYTVKQRDDSRLFQRQLQYLVKWRGYD
jgi:hypothetical protein